MEISFIGDVMLSRFVASQFEKTRYQVLDKTIVEKLSESDFVIGNLESPMVESAVSDGDHLSFKGNPALLNQFSFVNCFSLANNHINDCGLLGMNETIKFLDQKQIPWNGLYKDEYEPFLFEKDGFKCALFTCTDMMNHPIPKECPWNVLSIDDDSLDELIARYKDERYYVILYAHVGMLFTRFPNPVIRALLHKKIDAGADLIVTAHSHALGGMEYYKNKPIFHSIGDFVMDGNSYRRRQAAILKIKIGENSLLDWNILPTQIDYNFKTNFPISKIELKMKKSWEFVSEKLKQHTDDYTSFYKVQYKKEMLLHTISTLKFLLDTKGIRGMLLLIYKRFEEVKRMKDWITKDRSHERMDEDAISPDRKRHTQKDLFDID
ncbi:CapA family protein [uncultured Desulfobacter sp.]|uniref:CapA family protein n=1 Tax=uncultured Desulfobacter sp. TaxID=240139 RepID=UPI002AA6253E|nr:CapA family protein [uncultured Desulfobacter sp.]